MRCALWKRASLGQWRVTSVYRKRAGLLEQGLCMTTSEGGKHCLTKGVTR